MPSKYITRAAVVKMLREKAASCREHSRRLIQEEGLYKDPRVVLNLHDALAYERAADLVETFNDAEAEDVESWEIFAKKYGPAIQLMRSRIGLKE